MLLLTLVLAAPVPKGPHPVQIAPPPRPMSVWIGVDGTAHNYSREYFDANGVRRRRVHECDPELSRQTVPVQVVPGVMPEA